MKYDITISGTIGWAVTGDYIRYKLANMKNKRVDVAICSLGGYITDGLDIYQQFKDHGDVHAHFIGMSASAATVLAMGCKTVDMVKNSLILIHNASNYVFTYGSYNKEQIDALIEKLGQTRSQLQTIDEVVASIYSDRNGKSVAENLEKMKVAAWIKSKDALDFGLVNSIRDDVDDDEKAQNQIMNSLQPYNNDFLSELGLPQLPRQEEENPTQESLLQKAVHMLQGLIPSTNKTAPEKDKPQMLKIFMAVAAVLAVDGFALNKEDKVELTQDQLKTLDDHVKDLQDKLNAKEAEIANLKKNPATNETDAQRIKDLEKQLKDAQDSIKAKDEQIANLGKTADEDPAAQTVETNESPRDFYNVFNNN